VWICLPCLDLYYRLSAAPLPTKAAVNRGLLAEGLGSLLAGAWGTGNGTTSISSNIAVIGITKVSESISDGFNFCSPHDKPFSFSFNLVK